MRSWSPVPVPTIEGSGPPLRLYDSASDSLRETGTGESALMYVCGITPYDATHLGHAATYVTFDLVHRYWLDRGTQVRYVQNVTDVDDPLIERAARDGIRWQDLAERETNLFRGDMEALRVVPPAAYLGAVETMDLVVDAVTRLLGSGHAYRIEDGSVDIYFDITTDPHFGYVSRYDEATMLEYFAERGGDPDRAGKRNRLDPLLWKGERPDDPSWPSPLGAGRPGWHIECAAIALEHLGPRIDVQGGGSDLRFPHHEMSVAHAEALTDQHPFAHCYAQARMIALDGTKMSKSLGNLVFVSKEVASGTDPMALRLELLDGHYRTDHEFSTQRLASADTRLARWRSAVTRESAPPAAPVIAALREHLANDLDTVAALDEIDRWCSADGDQPGEGRAVADAVDALLGIRL